MEYICHIGIIIGLFSILSLSLNIVVGYAGIMSLSHAAFYGIGAYVASLMSLHMHTPFVINLACAMLISGIFGAILALTSIRLKGDYFVIATYAFQIIIFNIINNMVGFTGGPLGLPGIPKPSVLGYVLKTNISYLALTVVLVIFTYWFINKIVKSPFGRLLKTIREDELFAQASGRNVISTKIILFSVSASLAAISGVIYATYISYIDPTSFTILESIFIISIIIIGGAGNLKGSIVGAFVLVALPEALRFVGMPNSIAANVRQIIYGGILVVFMFLRPKGIVGEYSFVQENNQMEKRHE